MKTPALFPGSIDPAGLRAPSEVPEPMRGRWLAIARKVLGQRPGIGRDELEKAATDRLYAEEDGKRID